MNKLQYIVVENVITINIIDFQDCCIHALNSELLISREFRVHVYVLKMSVPGGGVCFIVRWFARGNGELVFTIESIWLPSKNCIILKTRDDCVTEWKEKHLKPKTSEVNNSIIMDSSFWFFKCSSFLWNWVT